jgi:uncharacterized protein
MQSPPEVMEPLAPGERFRFSCHRSIRCFTDCCRDLNLMLTPYDVLRLKRALLMDSTDFLDRHTLRSTDPDWNVPVLKLKMEEDASLRCPFVVEAGCRIYPDRPGACRAYPLGRAARQARGRSSPSSSLQEKFFLVKEPHCHGFLETREWTPEAWIQDQGVAEYNERNDRWMTFLTRYRPGAGRELSSRQWQMFFMACYSLDRFREFVFGTRFLSLFDISEDRQELLRQNDEALLEFSFLWLAFSLFNDPVLKLRPPGQG